MRLRTLLALMFSLLLAFTAASIGWRGYSSSRWEIKRVTQDEFAQANAFATHHVIDFLDDPANRLLSELTLRARRGMLALSDDRTLGADLAERVRVNPTLAWISYSNAATGHFVGAWRTATNDVVLNISTPGQGAPREMIIQPDGATVPYLQPSPLNEYDPRGRDWFRAAIASDTTVWSEPYMFVEGRRGITASRAWRATGSATPSGVFTVDFFLSDLSRLLDSVTTNVSQTVPSLFSTVFDPNGTVISTSSDPNAPAFTAALADWMKQNPHFKDNGPENNRLIPIQVGATDYLAAFDRINAPSGFRGIVASIAPRTTIFQKLNRATNQIIEIAFGALAVSLVLGALMAYRISEPLHHLGNDLASVGRFQLADGRRPRSVVREVNQLHEAAERMKSGLRSFIKYVPDDLVRQLLASGRDAALGGKIRRLTIFFSDIESFTAYSESVPPDRLVHELADYLEIVTRQLRKHSGTLDKFIGDGVLAFFNAPDDVVQHEQLACRAALAVLHDLDTRPRGENGAPFRTRIGLHAGDVLVGNLGTAERFAYTVLGDVVNVTSRLEGLNKIYGVQVLASGEVRDRAGNDFEWRYLDRAAVAGRKGAMEIYELLGTAGSVDSTRLRRRDTYEKALALYFARNFREAREIFAELTRECPTNRAAELMVTRCDAFAARALPADWDGVFAHEMK